MVTPIVNASRFFQVFWSLLPQPVRAFILFVFVLCAAVAVLNLLTGRS